jgi:chemotaxis family two-component system sensor histidine kinase/response regulator PixL
VLRQGGEFVALQVQRLMTEQELVIKPFSSALVAPDYLYGCTIMGDGNLIPVLDGLSLLAQLSGTAPAHLSCQPDPTSGLPISGSTPSGSHPSGSSTARATTLPTVLIVDDSAGMRQTLTLTLEKAGYRVLQARQGREALEQLQQHSHIQLVICDIEMPIMNGFEFLTQRRQDPRLTQIPVVMLTSRSGDKHRRLALQLGAQDYFTKPYIEREFLERIRALLVETNV